MIEVGKYNTLKILRETSVGLYLGDDEDEDILLPNKYCPEEYKQDEEIVVFVYRDYADRKIATNLTPLIFINEFAILKVSAVSEVGAFLDWGLEKDLLVPFKEQRQKMEEGRWYIVYMDLDTKTDRLYASNKIEKHLQNEELSVEEGDQVDLIVMQKTDLGFSVIVNNQHKGLVFENEIFKTLKVGDKLKGYIKSIREDNKLDISLQAIGYLKSNDPNTQLIYNLLQENQGYLAITDKSSPEEISSFFGISKKAFKKAIGALYKLRKIELLADGIKIAEESEEPVPPVEQVKASSCETKKPDVTDYSSYWNKAYEKSPVEKLGWYEDSAGPTMLLINQTELEADARILSIGAGASTFIDDLLSDGFENIIANDISSTALDKLKERLGAESSQVEWILDDVTQAKALEKMPLIDLWQDRAVLHFFNDKADQDSYFNLIRKLVKPDGFVIIAAYNLDGAQTCCGLPVHRYNKTMLQAKIGKEFKLKESFDYMHDMPSGDTRAYIYTLFQRN